MLNGKLTIKWKSFIGHIAKNLDEAFGEASFTDVTLISDEKNVFRAHKFVLSSCSPVLKDLLLNHPDADPIIYLGGVAHTELLKILQFMYLGKTNFPLHRLDYLYKTAMELKMQQLSDTLFLKLSRGTNGGLEIKKEDNIEITTEATNFQVDTKKSVVENIVTSEDIVEYPIIRTPVKEEEENRKLHNCDECDATFTHRESVIRHKKYKHRGIRYSCTYCDYKAPTPGALKIHTESIHECMRYPCNSCEYQATTQSNLRQHQKSVHEGKRFACDDCQYHADRKNVLVSHKKRKHSK